MKPAQEFRNRAAIRWGSAPDIINRTKNSLLLNNPNDKTKYTFHGGIGPIHFGPLEDQEIDTAWVPDVGAWQYKMVLADFNAYARDTLNAGTLVEYRNPYSNEWVSFQPLGLNWVNQDNSRQQLALPQGILASVNDDTLTWVNGYGAGKHFSYTTQTERLQKLLTIDSLANLPAPEPWMTGTLYLELELIIDFSSNVNMWIDGVEWDKSSTLSTGTYIEFKNTANETQWYLDLPYANDQVEREPGFYQVRTQGPNFYITVRVPKTWIDNATFPITIDPSVNVTIAASADDAYAGDGGLAKSFTGNTWIGVGADLNPPSRTVGVRFPGITIPGTATIDFANIELNSPVQVEGAIIPARIGVDAKDDAPAWTNATTFESEITLGTNFQLPDKVTRNYSAGVYYGTMIHANADLSALVQEIIDRPGWASGNAIRFVIQGYTGDAQYLSQRVGDYDTSPSQAPRISIDYTDGPPPSTTELTVTFPFATTAEGFTGVPASADITLSYDSGVGNPAGSLKTRIFGRNKVGISWWKYSGTWESLGVPAGETVSLMRLNSAYTRCTEWNVADLATIGAVEIWNSTETVLIATLYSGRSATGVEGSWVQTTAQTDQAIGSSYQASNTSIVIRIISNLDNGNNASAAISTYDDQYQFVITHTVASTSHDLTGLDVVTEPPVVGQGTLGQTHILAGQNVITEPPVVGKGALGQAFALVGQSVITEPPVVETGTLGQTHILVGVNVITEPPIVGQGTLGQTHILVGVNVITEPPIVGQGILGQATPLVGLSVITEPPVVETGTLGQTHILVGQNAITEPPVVGKGTLGQTHILIGQSVITEPPIVTKGTVTQDIIHTLTGLDVVTEPPVVGKGTLGQTHILIGQNVITEPPVVGKGVAGQIYNLSGQNVVTEPPVVEKGVLGQTHILVGVNVVTAPPEVSKGTMGQTHILVGLSVITEPPIVGKGTVGTVLPVELVGLDVVTEPPVVGKGVLGQTHILTGSNVVSESPVITKGVLGQTHILVGVSVQTEPPIVAKGIFGQTHVLVGLDIVTESPEVSRGYINFVYGESPLERTVFVLEDNRVVIIDFEDRTIDI